MLFMKTNNKLLLLIYFSYVIVKVVKIEIKIVRSYNLSIIHESDRTYNCNTRVVKMG